ncbi:MAG: hypothetical protein WBI82_16350 [Sphaerochaeta sp.]
MDTPYDIPNDAIPYLMIIFIGIIAAIYYNFLASIPKALAYWLNTRYRHDHLTFCKTEPRYRNTRSGKAGCKGATLLSASLLA